MSQVIKVLKECTNTRKVFQDYYYSNISKNKDDLVSFLKAPFIDQMGIFMTFIYTYNLEITVYKCGYSVSIANPEVINPLDIEAGLFYILDDDLYVYDTIHEQYGKTNGQYVRPKDESFQYLVERAIITSFTTLNYLLNKKQ